MAPNTDVYTRTLVVTLKAPFVGKSTAQIAEETGLPAQTINDIYAQAIKRGFEPNRPLKILPQFIEDAVRSGRPRKQEKAEGSLLQKSGRPQYLCYHRMESPKEGRIQENQANEEAWVDTEDEG
ncbi:hypothetical protein CC86DRAFT_414011 [Ophiobolus disseminans]|uniref:Uncharacterized protein n=1 Tax=Ophiobolus disseminans TaxID=1469910 RepID=A0A6A6ZBZ1_9PLEO|nr:hypothetical protein CC86DRAFT_414011 [Ophiobolus disseminans]